MSLFQIYTLLLSVLLINKVSALDVAGQLEQAQKIIQTMSMEEKLG